MAKPKKVGTIEISQDLEFQRKSWRVQRIAWVIMVLVVVAALLGLFGGGPLSSARAGSDDDGLVLQYERFTRANSPQLLAVEMWPGQPQPEVKVWFDRAWIEKNEITSVSPEPAATKVHPDRIVYEFQTYGAGGPLRAQFHIETRKWGRATARAGLEGQPTVTFTQFAYP